MGVACIDGDASKHDEPVGAVTVTGAVAAGDEVTVAEE